jgi:cold-inducible RNA-binding protein
MNIYVGNLSLETTEDDLRQAFAAFGQVRFVNIVRDGVTGESRGFGFVAMPTKIEAQTAINEMNGSDFKGQVIKVEQGRMRTNLSGGRRRPGRSGGTGGGGGRGRTGFGDRRAGGRRQSRSGGSRKGRRR